MVVISIIGVRMTRPKSIVVCAASAVLPSATSETSKEVPPRSPVMTFGKPAALRDGGRGDHAGRRAGQRRAHRQPPRRRGRHHAAIRLHDQQLARRSSARQSAASSLPR